MSVRVTGHRLGENGRHAAVLAIVPACAAIAAAPLGLKVPVGPVSVMPAEILMLAALLLLVPAGLRALRSGDVWPPLKALLPFVICALFSGISAANKINAARELAQIALHVVAGVWMFSYLSHFREFTNAALWSVRCALILGLVAYFVPLVGLSKGSLQIVGTTNGLACCLSLLLCLLVALHRVARTRCGLPDKALIALVALLGLTLIVWPSLTSFFNHSGDTPDEPIAQRYLEGYAALDVVSEYPLLGVGLGNYQERIGEFYQGMPKDNTIILGTRMGYCVLVASTGVLGLCGFLFWLVSLFQATGRCKPPPRSLQLLLVTALVWAFFTPVLVGQFLLPLAVAHDLIWKESTSECARSV